MTDSSEPSSKSGPGVCPIYPLLSGMGIATLVLLMVAGMFRAIGGFRFHPHQPRWNSWASLALYVADLAWPARELLVGLSLILRGLEIASFWP